MIANKVFFMKNVGIAALTILFLLASCSGSKNKKREELSATGELFENTTAKFNGYFNAKEIWIEDVFQLNDGYRFNYNQIIPIFPFTSNEDYLNYNDDMDKCIEKLATVITKHPASDWTDDSYLLMGKSYFVKKDYEDAINTFEYISNKYPPSYLEKIEGNRIKPDKKKKKKKKKKRRKKKPVKKKDPVKYTSINQYEVYDGRIVDNIPAFYENLIWLAHTYVELDQYIYAELALDRFEKYEDLPGRIKRLQHPVRAKWHLKQGELAEAVTELEKAIDTSKDQYDKARYSFIVAQLQTKLKNYSAARVALEDCIQFKPKYDMVFAAQLKGIQLQALQKEDPEKIQKSLEKLMVDGKNKEYIGHIYFAMAQLAVADNRLPDAEKYFGLSIKNNSGDKPQLAESYYYLADLNYKRQDYLNAKYYYDSTLMFMNKVDDRYFEVEAYSLNLADIAKNLEIIQLNDSLLSLVGLSEKERRDLAYQIQKQNEANRNNRNKNRKSITDSRFNPQRSAVGTGSRSTVRSSFFAYDEKAIKKGQKYFEKEWGDIQLKDFWRISSYGSDEIFDDIETESYESLILSDEDIDKLLSYIPDDPAKKAKVEAEKIEAMFQLGILYRERLEKLEKSIDVHEDLLKQYPNNPRELETRFYLYLNYQDLKQNEKSEEQKNIIIRKFPETNYAKALVDPDFLALTLDKEQRVKNYYDEVYADFTSSEYQTALSKIKKRDEIFEASTTYASKFELLAAMCIGNLKGRQEYIRSLREVIGKYRGTEESKRAKEILDVLGLYGNQDTATSSDTTATVQDTSSVALPDNNFKYEPEVLHYTLISYDNTNLNTNDAKVSISNFNNKYFRLDKLKVSNIFMNTSGDNPMLIIRKFKDAKEGDKYCQVLIEKQEEVLGGKAFVAYPISQANYRELMKIKSVDAYAQFYQKNYIR